MHVRPTGTGVPLSEGGIMSGVRACGGSMPLLTFCWMRCIARANCSLVSLPICLVSARALQGKAGRQTEDTHSVNWIYTEHIVEQNRTKLNQLFLTLVDLMVPLSIYNNHLYKSCLY